jgi:WD40 repeat protein
VTSVCCSNDFIFSASLDSTIASWNEISTGTFIPELTYYGHSSPVMCLQVIDSYQLLVSSSVEGKVLIHDIRSSFCLKKVPIYALSLGVSELGIIGICTQSSVEYYGINTEHILSAPQSFQAKSVKFNSTGDLAIEIYNKRIIIRDPTNLFQECIVKVADIQDLHLPYNERFMYSCRNDDKNMTGVYIFHKA